MQSTIINSGSSLLHYLQSTTKNWVTNPPAPLTPCLTPDELAGLGFSLAAYPLDLLNATIVAQACAPWAAAPRRVRTYPLSRRPSATRVSQRRALEGLKRSGAAPADLALPFADLQAAVGFPEYYAEAEKYDRDAPPKPK